MRTLTMILLMLTAAQTYAEEVLLIEGTRIRGNQELPTVLYVVPWQPVEIKQLDSPQTNFALNRPVEMLERTEFQRMVSYHKQFLQDQPSFKVE